MSDLAYAWQIDEYAAPTVDGVVEAKTVVSRGRGHDQPCLCTIDEHFALINNQPAVQYVDSIQEIIRCSYAFATGENLADVR